jgi:hypothetical protein
MAVIDHKTFPGSREAALEKVRSFSGQLAAYAGAIRSATGVARVSTWVHMPVAGLAVELRFAS